MFLLEALSSMRKNPRKSRYFYIETITSYLTILICYFYFVFLAQRAQRERTEQATLLLLATHSKSGNGSFMLLVASLFGDSNRNQGRKCVRCSAVFTSGHAPILKQQGPMNNDLLLLQIYVDNTVFFKKTILYSKVIRTIVRSPTCQLQKCRQDHC